MFFNGHHTQICGWVFCVCECGLRFTVFAYNNMNLQREFFWLVFLQCSDVCRPVRELALCHASFVKSYACVYMYVDVKSCLLATLNMALFQIRKGEGWSQLAPRCNSLFCKVPIDWSMDVVISKKKKKKTNQLLIARNWTTGLMENSKSVYVTMYIYVYGLCWYAHIEVWPA